MDKIQYHWTYKGRYNFFHCSSRKAPINDIQSVAKWLRKKNKDFEFTEKRLKIYIWGSWTTERSVCISENENISSLIQNQLW